MHKLEYENIDKKDWFLVSWTLSNKCNYRCSYCPDILHDGSTGHADWEQVKSFIENFEVPGKQICVTEYQVENQHTGNTLRTWQNW